MRIFIAGPRSITTLNEKVKDRLYGIYEKTYSVLVGDANGVDKAIQRYFSELNYTNVIVYASNGIVRNNLGDWQVETVPVSNKIKGFDFYAMKDKAMADNADYGFMLWNGESKGTLNNIINMLNGNKKVLVYFSPKNSFICIDSFKKLETLFRYCSDDTRTLFNKLYSNSFVAKTQITIFNNPQAKI